MISATEFKQAMRHLSGAVTIITTDAGGIPAGMTATAVCSLSAEPPTVLVCINKGATSHQPIQRSGRFTVNVLSAEDVAIARRFSVGNMESRFQLGTWKRLPNGGFALESALVVLDCSLAESIAMGTHSILAGQVEEVAVRPKGAPLVYLNGHYARINELDEP